MALDIEEHFKESGEDREFVYYCPKLNSSGERIYYLLSKELALFLGCEERRAEYLISDKEELFEYVYSIGEESAKLLKAHHREHPIMVGITYKKLIKLKSIVKSSKYLNNENIED